MGGGLRQHPCQQMEASDGGDASKDPCPMRRMSSPTPCRETPKLETSNSSLKVESHIHGNVNVWFGGGDTHVPSGYDGLYPTPGNRIRAGCGTPLMTARGRSWRRCSDGGRPPSSRGCKRCSSPLASRRFPRMDQGPTSGIVIPRSMTWEKRTHRKSRASTSIFGPGSPGWSVVRSAFPRRNACMVWSLGSLSIAMHLAFPSNTGSTDVKHLPIFIN